MLHRGVKLPMHTCFDLMCGTSTGGFIAASLSAPKPGAANKEAAATISDLRNFYEREASDVFSHSLTRQLGRFLTNPFGLFDETYDARPLERKLKAQFGWTSLASALTGIMLTAYDIEKRKAVFMTNGRQHDGGRPDDYYIWQAVRATTAAPTLFEPAKVENLTTGGEDVLIDGGVFMNDPAISAYIEGRKLGWSPEDITLISLGTGHAPRRSFSFREVSNWGSLGWIRPSNGFPILSILADGQSQTASYEANCLFTDLGETRYIRIDGEIPSETETIDNARPGNIMALNGAADRIIRDHTRTLDEFADMLIAAKASGQ